MHRRF
jgi:GT2 family glycosyltransferase